MTMQRRLSFPLPPGALRMTVVFEGDGWQQRYQLPVEEGREWRVLFAANRMEAVSAVRNRAEQAHIAAFSAALNATPDLVKREMREWMADRRMRLATITAPDLAAANSELQRRLKAAEGVAVPASDVPSAVTADERLDGEATSDDAGTATGPKPYAEMSLPELLVELRAEGIEGSWDDANEIRDFLEQLAAEKASASPAATDPEASE